MSGHSKFANIKHKKEKNDAAKGKIFTKIGRELAVAVKGKIKVILCRCCSCSGLYRMPESRSGRFGYQGYGVLLSRGCLGRSTAAADQKDHSCQYCHLPSSCPSMFPFLHVYTSSPFTFGIRMVTQVPSSSSLSMEIPYFSPK